MYKGLEQQASIVFSECSEATEVFVSASGLQIDNFSSMKEQKKSPLHVPFFDPLAERVAPPRLSSSTTSIIARPSSALIRHSSMSNPDKNELKRNVEGRFEKSCKAHVKFSTSDLDSHELSNERLSNIHHVRCIREILEEKRYKNRKTKADFIYFAKDFARSCRFRPMENLLNPSQYDIYMRDVPPVQKLQGSLCLHLKDSPSHIGPPSIFSSTIAGLNHEENSELSGHVVGDLVSFTENTARYFDNPDLSDVILVVGEHRFYSHKFALAAQSDVFRDMLIVSDRCTSCADFQKELELDESKECQDVFIDFLRFFYCGKITFAPETALPLLVLSAKYRVESLRVACDAFITGMIEDGDLKSAIRWLRYAAVYQLHDLTSKCVDGAISDNIEELVDTPDWLNLSADCVEAVLRSSSLLVPNEFFLFEALQRWFMNKRKTSENDALTDHLRKTLQQVRFSQMNGTQLLAVEESSIGLHFKSIIRSYLGDAYRYQILSKECPEFQEPQYLPRDYTDKEWCVQLLYNPSRNKRIIPSTFYGNGRWEIQPRRYYDTLNVVIILKKPLESDVKVYISILIYKRNGSIHMRLRRKACVLRAIDISPRPTPLSGSLNSTNSTPANSPRSTSSSSNGAGKGSKDAIRTTNPAPNQHVLHPHRSPHGQANKLHGPHNGQEYYAIDNIISDADFQMAMSNASPTGLKLGVIIRTWGANIA